MSMYLTAEPEVQAARAVGPVPLLIGVTGHRDLVPEDMESLRRGLADMLAELQAQYRHTPLVVLGGLAEGADRLAAEVAIASGASHIAVLPRPAEAYLDDFSTEQSRDQFQQLMSRSSACIIAQSDPSIKGYAEQGEWVAICSHIVLAIWDGRDGAGASGTADVVRLCLQGFKNPCSTGTKLLDPLETRPVWWVRARRLRHSQPATPFWVQQLYPGLPESAPRARKAYDKLLADTERYNRSVAENNNRISSAQTQSMDRVLPATIRQSLPAPMQELIHHYARADMLAIRYQRLLHGFMDAMLGCVFIAGFILQARGWPNLQQHVGAGWIEAMQWLPVIFFLMAAGFYYGERRSKLHTRYLDCRALAEGLRVQIFWAIAGVKAYVADEYLTRYRGEIEWIRRAIRATMLKLISEHAPVPDAQAILLKHWVQDQRRFFTRSAATQERLPKYVGLAWNFALIAGLAMAVLKMLPGGGGLGPSRIVIVAGVIIFGLGLIKLRIKILALSEQVRQYRRIGDTFARAEEKLNGGADPALVYIELGREALAENADWLLLHRERPLELPKV